MERFLEGARIRTPDDFYVQFFDVMRGLIPDYGGRNLDALNDDLRELKKPLTLRWRDSASSREQLGEWFERCVDVLSNRDLGAPVVVLLE
jgi:RNAse (barnase) inhibitor barstar